LKIHIFLRRTWFFTGFSFLYQKNKLELAKFDLKDAFFNISEGQNSVQPNFLLDFYIKMQFEFNCYRNDSY